MDSDGTAPYRKIHVCSHYHRHRFCHYLKVSGSVLSKSNREWFYSLAWSRWSSQIWAVCIKVSKWIFTVHKFLCIGDYIASTIHMAWCPRLTQVTEYFVRVFTTSMWLQQIACRDGEIIIFRWKSFYIIYAHFIISYNFISGFISPAIWNRL